MENEIIKNSIGFGDLIISESKNEISIPILYTVEDDAYYYIYCPKTNVFAYGNDINTAQDNFVSAVWVNIHALHKENRLTNLFLNQMDYQYHQAIENLRDNYNAEKLEKIIERKINFENTELIPSISKGAQLYEITKEITIKINNVHISRKAS